MRTAKKSRNDFFKQRNRQNAGACFTIEGDYDHKTGAYFVIKGALSGTFTKIALDTNRNTLIITIDFLKVKVRSRPVKIEKNHFNTNNNKQ